MTAPDLELRARGRSRRRLATNRVFVFGAIAAATIAVAILAIMVWSVFSRGVKALNLDFFTKGPAVFGQAGGGIAPALAGSFLLVAIATAMALPIGVMTAIYVSEFARKRIAEQIRL